MKLGARAFKTGLATAIALYVVGAIDFTAGLFAAAIAAASSIQPSIYRSVQTIIEQAQANIIGAGLGVILVMTVGNEPFVIGFGIVTVIGICMLFKMKEDTTFIAIIAVIAIMEFSSDPFIEHAGIRFTAIFIGIVSAFVVNLAFLPPKYETRLFEQINQTNNEIIQWIRVTTRHLSDQPALKKEIKRMQEDLTRIEQTYLLFSEERIYSRRKGYQRARKLVLFRQLIQTTKKAFNVLQNLHRMDYEIEHFKSEINDKIIDEIDKSLHSHEKLTLMYLGRIRKKEVDPLERLSQPDISSLVDSLMERYEDEENDRMKFLPLASNLLEYNNELNHLRKLLISYQHNK
ncbi:aromatic acid exporter family protein [Filobacillus milosensis]|uniref:Aromatic acid exporter family protein n=1 Tax=Filobacillus milosensis TaxID=94137 RepID=A0A4Y8IJY5_9BACI|nr:aromatic acid exporter family protein [Filobacillus milosensis]TFB13879.1 aromatic acid exporter family protein [Filobacillus milosensis]